MRLWWKHVARCLWTAVSYNFWHFSLWLLINATHRFFLISFLADKGLVLMRYISLTEIGSLVRSDWQILAQHPYIIFLSFFVYGFLATWFLQYHGNNETEIEAEPDRPWWEVLPVDSYWINCLFRPMATLTRPLPPSELELEEGIEMLIERLAVPNLWLQPVIPNEYIKDLPVWKFKGWDSSTTKKEEKYILTEGSPETLEKIMDGDDPYESICQCCINHNGGHGSERMKYRHNETTLGSRKKKHNYIELIQCKCMTSKKKYSATNRSPIYDSCNRNLSRSANVGMDVACNLCTNSLTNVSSTMVSNDDSSTSCKCSLENIKENISNSEESSDEAVYPPAGMLPATECAVCLETYNWGALLCGLPCGHNYHQFCIMVWLGRDNHHCPVCRWPAYKSKHGLSHLHRE
ncbi:hypothetical protein C0J52_22838 [Blattella germanica]|nr:hypothetical protein C0J52_22838 [Blattella germanica]